MIPMYDLSRILACSALLLATSTPALGVPVWIEVEPPTIHGKQRLDFVFDGLHGRDGTGGRFSFYGVRRYKARHEALALNFGLSGGMGVPGKTGVHKYLIPGLSLHDSSAKTRRLATPTEVPEPNTLALLAMGGLLIAGHVRRRRTTP